MTQFVKAGIYGTTKAVLGRSPSKNEQEKVMALVSSSSSSSRKSRKRGRNKMGDTTNMAFVKKQFEKGLSPTMKIGTITSSK